MVRYEYLKLSFSVDRKRWAKFEEWWNAQPYKQKSENLLKVWERGMNGISINNLTVDEISKLLSEKGLIIQRVSSIQETNEISGVEGTKTEEIQTENKEQLDTEVIPRPSNVSQEMFQIQSKINLELEENTLFKERRLKSEEFYRKH